jgi:hypothetical protein
VLSETLGLLSFHKLCVAIETIATVKFLVSTLLTKEKRASTNGTNWLL